MSATPEKPGHPGTKKGKNPLVFDDPFARPSADDSDEGWGERPASSGSTSAADLARFLDEKPPHHVD
ncbi:hypothetical protein AB0M28_05545 [Streptomyces sp. NPDC051940]|uniref:hypothetical protein n=1 Tax=Streptomyces sp. NPDC051940 TaxID=3155675 RepID=UPI0034464156